ncbi:MAG: endonuclease III [Selenomonas sp.]|jgi:endonuclease-3|uniref:endonuclease III n=1 Tax=Selenomonas sp. AE3005 TaxID=1485543 RepID=UPI0004856169|nr:endonuclease III [Selenomonas sp. AE3005]MBQ1417344.1 endonuclease III [Selenomonas sp.]MBQ1460695.1 endonuclease III [Selenomonas sp.]MBQ1615078.1 endonuclease III [Selenomonas sp.]MBQ1919141.1 endonuclease III [Selenomonas sp.]MBQ2087061.1 endonuclease III [Selenomonas sp.]
MRVTNKIKEEQIRILGEVYKDAKPALIFHNPFELLIAVILSAQCTDKRVNVTTARLFKKVTMPEDIMDMGLEKLEEEIRDCGLYHNKAKNIMGACQELCNKFQGRVPADFELLMELPGVGRKTANVVLSVGFDIPAIAVDTHVFRVANRLKLAVGDTPLVVEKRLMKAIPQEKWSAAHHWLIWHGRNICKARKPLCHECPLAEVCPSCQ